MWLGQGLPAVRAACCGVVGVMAVPVLRGKRVVPGVQLGWSDRAASAARAVRAPREARVVAVDGWWVTAAAVAPAEPA